MVNNTVMDVMRNDSYYDKYSDEELFSMKIPDLKVFKICTNAEYLNLKEVIRDNSIKI